MLYHGLELNLSHEESLQKNKVVCFGYKVPP